MTMMAIFQNFNPIILCIFLQYFHKKYSPGGLVTVKYRKQNGKTKTRNAFYHLFFCGINFL